MLLATSRCGDAEPRGAQPVDVDLDGREVEHLRDARIDHARDFLDLAQDALRRRIGAARSSSPGSGCRSARRDRSSAPGSRCRRSGSRTGCPGNSAFSLSRSLRWYSTVGRWPLLSEISSSASMPLVLSLGTKARLSENGRPMVELMVRSSFAGMISRMLCSTAATIFSVSSSRVPRGARMCILRMPTSELGKKSVPTTGASAPVATIKSAKQPSTNFRRCRHAASRLP